MTAKIRTLTSADLSNFRELLDLFGTVFEEPDTYCANQPSDAYLANLLDGGSCIVLIAESDNTIVGGLVAYEFKKFEQARSEIYIYDLAVAEPYRRRGIATALIDALKPIAKGRGAHVIFVQADPPDEPAVNLYSKLGIREDVLHFDIALD